MKEIRPSTWILLGIMTLLIFVPALFIDTGSLGNTPERDFNDYTPPPDAPHRPQVPDSQPANKPPAEDSPDNDDTDEDESRDDTTE